MVASKEALTERADRSRYRGSEKAITTALGVLLIAERVAPLSGHDDEFVVVVLTGFAGLERMSACYLRRWESAHR
jgi:hypothetical protein